MLALLLFSHHSLLSFSYAFKCGSKNKKKKHQDEGSVLIPEEKAQTQAMGLPGNAGLCSLFIFMGRNLRPPWQPLQFKFGSLSTIITIGFRPLSQLQALRRRLQGHDRKLQDLRLPQ